MDEKKDQLAGVGLQLDNEARKQLFETGKWSKFISIVVFIGCAIVLIAFIVGGTKMSKIFNVGRFIGDSQSSFILMWAIILFVIALFCATFYLLYNFSAKVKEGLITENTHYINKSLQSLKLYFIITTIFAILSLLSTIYSAFAA